MSRVVDKCRVWHIGRSRLKWEGPTRLCKSCLCWDLLEASSWLVPGVLGYCIWVACVGLMWVKLRSTCAWTWLLGVMPGETVELKQSTR